MDVETELFEQEPDIEDAIEAFMKSQPKDVDEESYEDEEETDDSTEVDEDSGDESEDEEGDEDLDESEEDEEETPAAKVAEDDAEVVVSVDGKEHRVSVQELKRLYGQEAAITQRSQALAVQRKVVDTQSLYIAQLLQERYDEAKTKASKYANVDLFRAARELEPEEFEALKAAKEAAESEVTKLETEGQEFLRKAHETRMTVLREQAKEALKVITKEIPEWSDELYGKVRTYAIAQGMDADVVNEIVDPSAIILMHKAMRYDEAQAASTKVQKKVTKAPKRVVKKGDTATDNTSSKLRAKRTTAMQSGDIDDVVELFLAANREE